MLQLAHTSSQPPRGAALSDHVVVINRSSWGCALWAVGAYLYEKPHFYIVASLQNFISCILTKVN